MLNKFFKTIHNKYNRFFKFIFFLRYLFAIFFISVVVFLATPIFINLEEKGKIIKSYLLKNYNFEINNYEKIKYNIFHTQLRRFEAHIYRKIKLFLTN